MAGKKRPRRPKRAKAPKTSHKAEAAYKADLLQVCKFMDQATEQILLPVLRRTEPQYIRMSKPQDSATPVRDGYAGDIMQAFDQLTRAMGAIDSQAARLAQTAVQRQRLETEVQIARNLTSALGIDVRGAVAAVNVTDEVEAATIANTQLIKSLPTQYIERIKVTVLNDVQQGRRYEQLAADIEHQMGVTENRAKLIARDQMSKVNASINEAKQTGLGVGKYEWSTSGDERVRDSHAEHDGKIFRWDSPPADTGHPGEDVNCFPAWSQVEFTGDVKRAFRHWYTGELTLVITDAGESLYATPNHPVLTDAGWKPIKAIKEGDNLIHVCHEGIGPLEENQDNPVSRIADVFESLSVDGIIGTIDFGGANFHGDAPESDVDVVNSAGCLPVGHDLRCIQGSGNSRAIESDPVMGRPATAIVGGVDSLGAQQARNSIGMDEDLPGDFCQGKAIRKELRRAVYVGRINYSGHVYNLETDKGWYVTQGVVTHNCRCVAIPVIDFDE